MTTKHKMIRLTQILYALYVKDEDIFQRFVQAREEEISQEKFIPRRFSRKSLSEMGVKV
jgi:hypothetical protein